MLEALRRGVKGIFIKILLGLLIIAFAVWGVADVFQSCGQGPLAKIGKTEISTDAFQQALQVEISNLSRQFGRRLTVDQARALGIDQRVISRLVGTAAIDNHARDLGLYLSDATIADAIRNDPGFQGVGGIFNRDAFVEILRQNGLTEQRYFAERRADEIRQQITGTLTAGNVPPAVMIDTLHRYRGETRTIALFTLDPEVSGKVADPDEAKMKAYYEQNKRQFVAPEYRKVPLILLTDAEVRKRIDVSDADMKALYEQEKDTFATPERRKIQQLSFPDRAAADKALADSQGGSVLRRRPQGARPQGQRHRTRRLDQARHDRSKDRRRRLQAREGPAFRGRPRHVRQRDPAGHRNHARQAEHLRRGQGSPARPHRRRARRTCAPGSARSRRRCPRRRRQPQGNRRAAEGAVHGNRRHRQAGPHARRQTGARQSRCSQGSRDPPSSAAAASIARRSSSSSGGYAWVDVAGVTAERQKPFEEVQDAVKAAWIEAERRTALNTAAQAIVDRVNKGTSLEDIAKELNLEVKLAQPVTRSEQAEGLTRPAVQRAFSLARGTAAAVESADGKSRTIIAVRAVVDPPPPTTEQRDALRKDLERQLQSDAIGAYVNALQTRLGFTINETVYRRAMGLEAGQ